MSKLLKIFTTALALWLMSTQPAYAYLDPGSGSYIIQILVGSVLGGAYLLRMNWLRLKDFLTHRLTKNREKK